MEADGCGSVSSTRAPFWVPVFDQPCAKKGDTRRSLGFLELRGAELAEGPFLCGVGGRKSIAFSAPTSL